MLLAVTALDRTNANVQVAVDRLSVALPFATAANVFYTFRRRSFFRISERYFLIAAFVSSTFALFVTLFAIHAIFLFLAPKAAAKYDNAVGVGILILVLGVAIDMALYTRWSDRRRKQRVLRRRAG